MTKREEDPVTAISTPERVGGRDQARLLAEELFAAPGVSITVDFSHSDVVTPSFIDELVKVLLEERRVGSLTLKGLGERERRLATRSAGVRSLSDHLLLV
jgi:hypothetical protein